MIAVKLLTFLLKNKIVKMLTEESPGSGFNLKLCYRVILYV